MVMRLAAATLGLTLALTGCVQGGSPGAANQAANEFLLALVRNDSELAWSHLHPDSQRDAYDGDQAAFAREVDEADWSQFRWEFGPVVNFDVSWEIHLTIDEATVPDFLFERGIAAMADPYLVMQVQTPFVGPYLILAWERG
jgi:hypothetical protein